MGIRDSIEKALWPILRRATEAFVKDPCVGEPCGMDLHGNLQYWDPQSVTEYLTPEEIAEALIEEGLLHDFEYDRAQKHRDASVYLAGLGAPLDGHQILTLEQILFPCQVTKDDIRPIEELRAELRAAAQRIIFRNDT